jgi:hypothetical protein
MCSLSAESGAGSPIKEWCGTGWTGQPNLVPMRDGRMMLREGAYDGHYHFLDAGTGEPVMPDLATGDLAKGSATSDPDGFPLYYAGSRDGIFRVVSLDRAEPEVLYEIDALDTSLAPRPMWNDDWDGAALVIDDVLIEGGENGYLYLVPLNRSYRQGLVTIRTDEPIVVPAFDDELLAAIEQPGGVEDSGLDTRYDVSIESSVAYHDGVAYVANSGGLITGWDISDVLAGGRDVRQVFRFWAGDDTDASIVIDDEGYLYVASEYQRFTERSRSLGQLMKLDPRNPDDPVVWSVPALELGFDGAGGSWSTPAISGEVVFATTAAGRLMAIDRSTGNVRWERQVGSPAISSPVVVDGVLVQGDCSGNLSAWDVSNPNAEPVHLWTLDLGDCIESTPAVWNGWLFVGTREGYLYGIADAATPPPTA